MSRFLNWFLALWIGLLWGVAGCRSSSPKLAVYPVRYTAEVDWPKGCTLEQLKDLPVTEVSELGAIDLEHNTTNHVTALTWREYDRWMNDGYYPADNFSVRESGWFFKERGYIPFLEKAQPSRISYVHDLRLNRQLLKGLPIDLGPLISPQQIEEAQQATKEGKFWLDFYPAMKIKKRTKTMMQLEGGGDSVWMRVMAYGDYDHDGYEDVLLYVAYDATEGTLGFADTVVLTRKGPQEPLQRVGPMATSEVPPVPH